MNKDEMNVDYIKLVAHNGKKDPHAILLLLPLPDADETIEVTDIIDEGVIPLASAERDIHTAETLANAGYTEVHKVAHIMINMTEYKTWQAKMVRVQSLKTEAKPDEQTA